ncbi:hypothetical protein EMCRGX_G004853 [Ephydatia muelleri]
MATRPVLATRPLEERFSTAVAVIRSLPKQGPYQPSNAVKLRFYALYKQSTEGPCNEPQPSIFNMTARYKWEAWHTCGTLSKEEAMRMYVEELKTLIETMPQTAEVEGFLQSIGPFYQIEPDKETEAVVGPVSEQEEEPKSKKQSSENGEESSGESEVYHDTMDSLMLDTSELQTIGSPQGRGESGDRRLHGTGEERGLSDLGRMLQGVCGQLERLQHQVQALYERVDRLANPARPAPERAERLHQWSVWKCGSLVVMWPCLVNIVLPYLCRRLTGNKNHFPDWLWGLLTLFHAVVAMFVAMNW